VRAGVNMQEIGNPTETQPINEVSDCAAKRQREGKPKQTREFAALPHDIRRDRNDSSEASQGQDLGSVRKDPKSAARVPNKCQVEIASQDGQSGIRRVVSPDLPLGHLVDEHDEGRQSKECLSVQRASSCSTVVTA